jgi:hypothetical protein
MSGRRQKRHPQKAEPGLTKRASRLRKAAVVVLSGVTTGGPGPKRAVIVDQLSLTQPNPDFVESATGLLQRAGYVVDYFPGEQVTVEFYRELPTHDYDLIILRVHSGISSEVDVTTGEKASAEYVALFTGEPYSENKYPDEPERSLGKATYYEGAPPLFGIGPEFIAQSMRGSFDDALIVLMGCDGLRSQTTAQAFLDRGASAFVSWSRSVSVDHTDAATVRLLEKLLIDRLPVGDAVTQTAAELGPDPSYGAELRVLPAGG